jgi:hypothetical protein
MTGVFETQTFQVCPTEPIIWDKEQIRYSSYLPKYATHTFLIPNIPSVRSAHQIKFSPEVAFGNSSPMCDLLGLTSQTK